MAGLGIGLAVGLGSPSAGGGGGPIVTKGELIDDNLSDLELCDDSGDIMLIED